MNHPEKQARYLVVYPVKNKDIHKILEELHKMIAPVTTNSAVTFSKYPHITLCPPFCTSYLEATRLSMGIAFQDLNMNYQNFMLGKLRFFRNKDVDVLYFEVLCDSRIRSYVKALRRILRSEPSFNFEGEQFDAETEPKLHITICSGKSIAQNREIGEVVEAYNTALRRQQGERGPLRFGMLVSCLYALYPDGWSHLSENPEIASTGKQLEAPFKSYWKAEARS